MSDFGVGMGTTPGMWEMVSEALVGEKLPDSVSEAIYALCDGKAFVARWVLFAERTPTPEHSGELLCREGSSSPFMHHWRIDEDEYLADGAEFYWLDMPYD